MEIYDIAEKILKGELIKDKLIDFDLSALDFSQLKSKKKLSINFDESTIPGRKKNIAFSPSRSRFPKLGAFNVAGNRARAIHFFANHELMAIEIMAYAILKYPHDSKYFNFKQKLLATIKDEQKHLSLYIDRIHAYGSEFGDFPLNDFFWKQMNSLKTPENFMSVVSLTFEAANLDFAKFYKEVFKEHDDFETANCLDIIYRDEIRHVFNGVKFFNDLYPEESLVSNYLNFIPEAFSPGRAKGIVFDESGREKAGFSSDDIKYFKDYKDSFAIVNRSQWKK